MTVLQRLGLLLSLMLGFVLAGGMPAPGQTVSLTTLHAFQGGLDGENPYAPPLMDAEGNLYVATKGGGLNNFGEIIKMTPSGVITILHSFLGAESGPPEEGEFPNSIIFGTDGNIYGTTDYGGANGFGTVFKLTLTGTLTTLQSFGLIAVGSVPRGLFQGQDGNFYGYTLSGGSYGGGIVFKITPAGTFSILCSFAYPSPNGSGGLPGGLTQGNDGNLYGTTWAGGIYNLGTFYKLTPSGWVTYLYDFNEADGSTPLYLMQATDGNFYGTTSFPYEIGLGAGTVYKITPDGAFTSLHAFHYPDGRYPFFLIQGQDGNFYGTTADGGMNDKGTIFMITPTGDLTTLYSFGGLDGQRPYGIVQAPDGTFYGVTFWGGPYGYNPPKSAGEGTIYHLVTGLSYVPDDFNRDSKPDLLFQNRSTGQLALWYLLEGSQDGRTPITPTQDPHWQAIAVTALKGDEHPDVLFHNPSTGRMAFWFMNNSQATDGVFVSPTQDPDWKPVGMADFNGDGHPDILFAQPNTGQLALWYMNRNYLVSATYVYPVQDPNWQVVGLGDFNGDGHPDILFQNASTGQLVVWYMGGTNYAIDGAYITPVPDAGWQAVAVEDFDGDGHPDILLQNPSTGQLAIWYMNNNQRTSQAIIPQVPDPQWKVVGPR